MNLMHSSAICCSTTLLPLLVMSCLFANCFASIGKVQNNACGFSEGSGAAPNQGWAVAGLSRALGQTPSPGCEGDPTTCVLEGKMFTSPARSLLARHSRAAGWITFRWWCGKEQCFERLLWFVLPNIRSN